MLSMDRRKMASIENLEASQRTRPRHWIPVYCFIVLLFCVVVCGAYAIFVLPTGDFGASIYGMLPNLELVIGEDVYNKDQVFLIMILPIAMLVVNLFALIGACRMASFRRAYWLYAIWPLIAYIAMALLVAFWNVYTFAAWAKKAFSFMTPEIVKIIGTVFVYGNLGYSALLLISMIFGLFYNVNYPARYERIYMLRKRHLKALRKADEKIAYKKKFYRDYRLGKWNSMMLDLHAESYKEGSTEKMDQDAYEFLVYYTCLCDTTVKKAIFDEYARHGRYLECRTLFHSIKTKSEAVENGAKVHIPTYVPPVEPRVEVRPKPVAPKPEPPAPKRKHYRPDEI